MMKYVLLFMLAFAVLLTSFGCDGRNDFFSSLADATVRMNDISGTVAKFLPFDLFETQLSGYNGVYLLDFEKFYFVRVTNVGYDGTEYIFDFALEEDTPWRLFRKDWYLLYTNFPEKETGRKVRVEEPPAARKLEIHAWGYMDPVDLTPYNYNFEPVYITMDRYLELYH